MDKDVARKLVLVDASSLVLLCLTLTTYRLLSLDFGGWFGWVDLVRKHDKFVIRLISLDLGFSRSCRSLGLACRRVFPRCLRLVIF